MRAHGIGGETMTIMRHVIHEALRHSRRRHRKVGYSLVVALLTVSALGIWRITALNREKRAIDAHIRQLEAELQKSSEAAEKDRLLARSAITRTRRKIFSATCSTVSAASATRTSSRGNCASLDG